jgi:hypothetical protein
LTGPSGREDLHPKKSEVQAKTADKRKKEKEKKKKRKEKRGEVLERKLWERELPIKRTKEEGRLTGSVDQHQSFGASRWRDSKEEPSGPKAKLGASRFRDSFTKTKHSKEKPWIETLTWGDLQESQAFPKGGWSDALTRLWKRAERSEDKYWSESFPLFEKSKAARRQS